MTRVVNSRSDLSRGSRGLEFRLEGSRVWIAQRALLRVVTIFDALWVEISDGGCPRPVGGLRTYWWPRLWAVGVVAGGSVGATPPSETLLRD